jgi:hypothetical protein
MTMMQNGKQKWKNTTLKSLEARLRSLGKVKVPETLKVKLFATIPDPLPQPVLTHEHKWRFRVRSFSATAAAAVLIFAFMFMVNHALSTPTQALLTELDDVSLCYRGAQPYSMYDHNDGAFAKIMPRRLQRLIINPNELGY